MKKPLFNGNKKKLIIAIAAASATIVLAVVLVLVLVLGGKKKDYNVNGAADLLDATYIDQIEDGRVDYELLNSIAFQGNTYSVKWSVDVTEGVKLVVNGNVTKVDVDEASEDDVDYTLTATVSDPNGNTATVNFYATLLKAKALIPVEITASPEEGTAYRLYVYQNDAKKDCYFNGNIAASYYLGSVEDYESAEAVKVYVEYKEGSTTEFYMYFEHVLDGKQYINVVEKWHNKNGGWTYNPEISGTPSNTYTYSTEYNTIISTVAARSVTEENYDAPQDTTQVIYFGNSGGTYTTIGSVVIEEFGKEGFVANLVTLESAKDKTPEEKIAFEKDSLLLKESYTGAQTIEVRTYGKRYPDVKIDWTVSGENVSYADGKLTITAPTAETTATIKATITVGDKTETKEFTITLKPAIDVPAAGSTLTIPEANALGEKFEQDVYTEGKYYVTGVVKSVPNTTYGNLYIKDADGNEFYIYGLYDEAGARYDAMTTKPVAGDTITVYGIIGKHNSAQMKNGTMTAYTAGEVVTPTECTITEALAAADDAYVAVTGTVKTADAWNTQFNNMCVTITDDTGAELYVFRLATQVNVGDKIKVTGYMATYNEARQIAQGATAEIIKAADAEEADVTLTIENLNLPVQTAYITEETSIDVNGVTYKYIGVGSYGNGIQCRTKNGVSAIISNSTALSGNIAKIVLTPNAEKSVYSGNAWTAAFGTTAECTDATMTVKTDANGVITIEVTGEYKFFKLTHANTYTQYWDSIEIFFAEDKVETKTADVTLTIDNLNLPVQTAYITEEASIEINGVTYKYIGVGSYGNGIQCRTKNGVSAIISNSTALSKNIAKIVLTPNAEKSVYSGNAWTAAFGTTAECTDATMTVKTDANGVITIEVTGEYKFFKLTHANTYTQYWDSIEIFFA